MEGVDRLLEKHASEKERVKFSKDYERARIYFVVRDDWSMTQEELAAKYNVSQSSIGLWRKGAEQKLVGRLRRLEEERIVNDWAQTESIKNLQQSAKEYAESIQKPPLQSLELGAAIAEKINPRSVRHAWGNLANKSIDASELSAGIRRIYKSQSKESHLYYSDLRGVYDSVEMNDLEKALSTNQDIIEHDLRNRLGLEKQEKQFQIVLVEGRLYIWLRTRARDDMLSAWSKLYFYPKDTREFRRLSETALENIGLDPTKKESKMHFNRILDSILDKSTNEKTRKSKHLHLQRLQGETLRFLMDIDGLDTEYLNGKIRRITGINGQGGIQNPRFLSGEQLKEARARMMAAGLSDCHLQPGGHLAYFEEHMERISRFETTLKQFGRFSLSPHWIEKDRVYQMKIPTPFGCAVEFWGLPTGDKSAINPHLPEYIRTEGDNVAASYLETMISEEGHADEKSYCVSWNRTNLLDGAEKNEQYNLVPQVGPMIKEMIRERGHGGFKNQRYLTFSEIEALQDSEDPKLGAAAKSLLKAIKSNRNHLLDDEAELPKRFGIEMEIQPRFVRFYENSGRVSVYWEAKTASWKDAFRWGIIAPPNDERKRSVIRSWFERRPNDLDVICKELRSEGHDYREWWSHG
jgi:hypothetical protein